MDIDKMQQFANMAKAASAKNNKKNTSGITPNPLAKYFRQPGIHITLPSRGLYNKEGEIDFEDNGELPIYPMTAADEIIIKNPDSLLNGSALERLLNSCTPNIKAPKLIPICDVDVIMMAIRKVSYGDRMPVSSKCPKCGHENDYEIEIDWILSQVKNLPDEHFIRATDDLVVYISPYTLSTNNRINLATFEETKLLQNMVSANVQEGDRVRAFTESFAKITHLNIELLSESILRIATPDGDVTNPRHIHEFIRNADKRIIDKIREGVKFLNGFGLPKTIKVSCQNPDTRDAKDKEFDKENMQPCGNEYETEIVYDPVSFFANASSELQE